MAALSYSARTTPNPCSTTALPSFHAQTAPVVDHYRSQSRFAEVDGAQPAEAVTAQIDAILRRLREQTT